MEKIMEKLKVLIGVDESNMTGSVRGFGRKMEWCPARDYLANPNEGRYLSEMVVYVGLPPNTEQFREKRAKKEKFVHYLRTKGFMVVIKEGHPAGIGEYKSNVDVLMSNDLLELASEIRPDIVVICSGDYEFGDLARRLRRKGIRVEVASVGDKLSNELKAAANSVIDLEPLLNQFERMDPQAGVIGTDAVFDL
ncbi:MAG: NYN domain-containing protein [SAR324 cluster bacterium]|nr:NYN domain-containing protein [SAR324 cluster bacterium]